MEAFELDLNPMAQHPTGPERTIDAAMKLAEIDGTVEETRARFRLLQQMTEQPRWTVAGRQDAVTRSTIGAPVGVTGISHKQVA